MLWGLSGLFMLLACAGASNVLWTRSVARRRDTATRIALGASRGRIAAESLIDTLLLATVGAVLGGGLAVAWIRLFDGLWPVLQGQAREIPAAAYVLLLMVVAGVATAACGAVPAWGAARTGGATARQPARGHNRGLVPGTSVSETLAGLQLVVVMVLVVCTAVVLSGLVAKLGMPLGFTP